MPRKPRTPKRRRYKDTLAENQRFHLLTGLNYPYFDGPEYEDPSFPFQSEEQRRRLWERHEAEIMGSIGSTTIDHVFQLPYFSRPRAFYDYEDPPPFKVLTSTFTCYDGEKIPWERREKEVDYLKRNKHLLLPEEKKTIQEEKK